MSVKELEEEVKKHNYLYFVGNAPVISDYEFDQLVEELKRRRPDSPVLAELVSDIESSGKKVRHDTPMLSLDKCYDEKEIADWTAKFEGDVIASPKLDGIAVSIKYDKKGNLVKAATRGDGVVGEDVTANVFQIGSIPHKINLSNVEIRGEVHMPLSVFKGFKNEFANPRNLAAGAIKQKDPKRTKDYKLAFQGYDLLNAGLSTEKEKREKMQENDIPVATWVLVKKDELQKIFESFLSKRDENDFETDGVVFKANLVSEQERLGVTAHHPRYAIAYKYQGESGVTTLIDVEWGVARTGVITPVALVKPVELSGANVSRASLHNVGIIKKLGLTRGAKVLMMRRGGVIPNVESVIENGKEKITIPNRCPSCGGKVELKEDFLYCLNPKRCVESKVAELEHFIKEIGCDGFGNKLITKLYENEMVADPSELYTLTKDDLLLLERMGEKLAAKLIGNIEATKEMHLDVFLRSLGIRELGRHSSKILAQYGDLKEIMSLKEEELSNIHTIGPVIAREVVQGLKNKEILIEKLLKHIKIIKTEVSRKEGPLAGKSFLFTGSLLSMDRRKVQSIVEENGGIAAGAVTKELDYLVVGDGGGAGSKLQKVEKMISKGGRTKIMSEKEFLKMIKIK